MERDSGSNYMKVVYEFKKPFVRCFIESEPQGFSNSTTTTTQAPVTTTVDNGGNTEQCTCGIPNRSNRIVGGQETEVNEYPWQVGLVSSSGTRPWCGGTLISDRHVMTAAHCTAGSSASSIKVRLGRDSFEKLQNSKHDF